MKTNIHFFSLSHFFLQREISRTKFVEKIKTPILGSITFFSLENRAVYQVMWKNIADPDWLRIPKATDTHSEYVTGVAFPLHERASILRYTYIMCLVKSAFLL
jgi:hypothetical protein